MRTILPSILLTALLTANALAGGGHQLIPGAKGAGFHTAQDSSEADMQIEPIVSKKEAELINDTLQLNLIDPDQAVMTLEMKWTEESSAAIDFVLGSLYHQQERFEEAAEAYQGAIKKLPLFLRALNNLAKIYMLQEQYDLARQTLQTIITAGRTDPETMLLLGHALLYQGNPVSAESAYRHVLMIQSDQAEAERGLIKALLDQERIREALKLTETRLAKSPSDPELWNLRANAQLALEKPDQAIVTIETARRLGQTSSTLLMLLGDLYLNRHQPTDATTAYRLAFAEASPSIDRLLRAIESLLHLDALAEAEQLLQQLASVDSSSPVQQEQQRWLQAKLAAARGETETARSHYEALVETNPLHGKALLSLADLHLAAKRIPEAELAYERAARIDGFQPEALIRHALLEVEQNRYTQAIELLQRAQAFKPQPHVARYLKQLRRLAE